VRCIFRPAGLPRRALHFSTGVHTPLQDFGDFLQIGDYFLPFTSQNEWGVRRLLYVLQDQGDLTDPLLAEFEELAKRLREYPPLKPYLQ